MACSQRYLIILSLSLLHCIARSQNKSRAIAGRTARCVSSQLLQKLQVVQNAAACLFTGARRCELMIPVFRELHWLPIRRRITFKTAVPAYKCQHDAAPRYLQSYCESTSTCTHCTGRRYLRSSQMRQLVVPRTRTKYGDHSFAVQGPRVWNSLPIELCTPDIAFRNKLKTYLFDIT